MLSGFYSFTQGPRSDITTGDFPLNATAPRITLGNGRSVADPFFNPVLYQAGRRNENMLAADSVHLVNMRVQKSFRFGAVPRLELSADVFNLFNSDAAFGSSRATSGPPTSASGRASSSPASHSLAQGSCSDRYPPRHQHDESQPVDHSGEPERPARRDAHCGNRRTTAARSGEKHTPRQKRTWPFRGRSRRRRGVCGSRFQFRRRPSAPYHRSRLRRDLEGQRPRTATADGPDGRAVFRTRRRKVEAGAGGNDRRNRPRLASRKPERDSSRRILRPGLRQRLLRIQARGRPHPLDARRSVGRPALEPFARKSLQRRPESANRSRRRSARSR